MVQYRLYVCVFLLALGLAVPAAQAQPETKQPPNIEDFSENSLVVASAKYLGATAEAMAQVVDHAFSRYGMPSAIIRGEEMSVSAMFGVRYGRGTLIFKDGRQEPIYWRGPSLGLDMGATGSKSFALVYNVNRPEDLHKRLPGVDGSLIAVGGVAFHYLRRGSTIVAPMRVGVGYQVGISLGYVKFSPKRSWLPF